MVRRRVQVMFPSASLTRQSERDACDLSKILARFSATGFLPPARQGQYLDVSAMPDYRSALHAVRDVEAGFRRLPSRTRARFGNDPAEYLDFMADREGNLLEGQQLGLFPKGELEPAIVVPVVGGPGGVPPVATEVLK